MVNNSNLVNIIEAIRRDIAPSGIKLTLKGNSLHLIGPNGTCKLEMLKLYRPSRADIEAAIGPNRLLVLTNATELAAEAAHNVNHILIPQGGYRILAPGIAIASAKPLLQIASRKVQLSGKTAVVAETLLLDPIRSWSLQDLAKQSSVSTALAYRVAARLEEQGLLVSEGKGPHKARRVANARALLELWAQEENPTAPGIRGFLYAPSTETLAIRALESFGEGACGGILAANHFKPLLVRVNPPLQIWVSAKLDLNGPLSPGFERTEEGANLEVFQVKGDPWRTHSVRNSISYVSKWRAWVQVSKAKGRVQELAEALLTDLENSHEPR